MNVFTHNSAKTGFLPSTDQTSIFYRHHVLKDRKAYVVLVHGFGEHSGRYAHVIDALYKDGFEVLSIDFRGHGNSLGRRGDVEKLHHYEDDVKAALNYLSHQKNDDKKIFLIAHSLGGLISLRMLAQNPFSVDGIILSSPLLALKMSLPFWKKWASLGAARMMPTVAVKTNIYGKLLSKDTDIIAAYDNDPLVLKNLTIRTFCEIYYGYKNSNALARSISLPIFMQIAGDDPVVDSEVSKLWFQELDGTVDATLKVYPGCLHEIYNELNRQLIIGDFLHWLHRRL